MNPKVACVAPRFCNTCVIPALEVPKIVAKKLRAQYNLECALGYGELTRLLGAIQGKSM